MSKKPIQNNKEKKGHAQGGYALLFAVLVSAVVLGVGVSILNISRKEILLTAGAQQSQYAFYAADTGYECAIYDDLQNESFVSTTTGTNAFTVNCGAIYSSPGNVPSQYSAPVSVQPGPSGINTAEYQYSFSAPVSAAGACVAVLLKKDYTYTQINASTTLVTASTTILADGFNTGAENFSGGDGDCNGTSNTKVERALLSTY